MNNPLPNHIVDFSENLLVQLLELKNEFPWLTFWLRSQDNQERLSNGLWFQGTEDYLFIGLVKLGSSNNRTKSIGFIVEFDSSGNITNIALEVVWGGITEGKLVEFFNALPNEIKGLEQVSPKKLTKKYHTQDPHYALIELVNNDLPDLIRVIHEYKLGQQLLITEPEFQKLLAKTQKFRSEMLKQPNKLSGDIWLGGSIWDKDKTDEFLRGGVWRNGNTGKYTDKINATKQGDYLLLKSINRRQKPGFLILKAIGRVLHNPKDGERLDVVWKRLEPFAQIERLNRYNLTYHKLQEKDISAVSSSLSEELVSDLNTDYQERLGQSEQRRNSKLLTQSLTYTQPNYDSVTGDDALNITNDVNVFGAILALKSLKPPFAVALFGNWGSGKSFFMNKLKNKIGLLSQQKDIDSDNERLYCKNIAQIDFNAWSYLDANLWAGLMSSILQRLEEYLTGSKPGDNQKGEVLQGLEDEFELALSHKSSIQENISSLKKDLVKLNLEQIKNDRDTAIKALETFRLEGYQGLIEQAVKAIDTTELQNQLKELGFDEKELDPTRASDSWKSIKLIGRQFGRLNWKDGLLVIIVLFLILAVPFLTEKWLSAPWLSSGLGYVAILFGIVRKVSSAFKKVIPVLDQWANKKEEFSKLEAEAELEYERQLLELEDKRTEVLEELSNQEHVYREINEKIELLEYEKDQGLDSKALFSFISKRSKSEDYENQLGIISLIRRDLETLSALFLGMDIDKDMPEPEKKLLLDKEKRLSKIRKKMGGKSLDRIILYIDDLDRCPDEKVLDVLQAVHLLMAFPIFIVVVGVDSRSVTNALYYRNVIKYSQGLGLKDPKQLQKYGIHTVKPSEYLEKIFQIPFQLKKPSESSVRKMMGDIVGNVQIVDREQKIEIAQPSGNGITVNYLEETLPEISEKDNDTKSELVTNDVPKEALELTSVELQDMQALNWMVGENPRAIKRFINMYRLIRAHAGVIEVEEEKELERLIMMFVLAFYIGPYREYVEEFEKRVLAGKGHLKGFLTEDLKEGQEMSKCFNEIYARLSGSPFQKILLELDSSLFQDHLKFIRRFTFPIENSRVNEKLVEEWYKP